MKDSRRTLDIPVRTAALFAVALAVAWGWATLDARPGLTWEFAEYADTAREIARGHGFDTHISLPSTLAYYDAAGLSMEDGTGPQLYRHPGFAFSLAAFFVVLGADDGVMVLALCFFFAAWISGSYLLLRRPLGEHVALATALLLTVNPVLSRYFVAGGYAAFLFGLSALGFLVAATRLLCRDGPPSPLPYAALGLLAAWCWLLRFNFSLVVGLFLGLAVLRLPRSRPTALALLAFVAAFLAGVVPFRVWQAVTFGTVQNPATWWNLLDGVAGGRPWMQYRTWGAGDLFAEHRLSRILLRKLPHLGQLTLRELPDLFHFSALMPFFFVALLRRPGEREASLLLRFAALTFAVMAGVLAAFRYEVWFFDEPLGLLHLSGRYFVWFAPLAVAFGLKAMLDILADRSARTRAVLVGVVVLAQVGMLAPYWSPSRVLYPGIEARWSQEPIAAVLGDLQAAGALPAEGLLATNVPAQVAWYLDRAATTCPFRPDDLLQIAQRHPLVGFHFTRSTLGEPHNLRPWTELLDDQRGADAWFAEIGMVLAFRDNRDVLYLPSGR